MADCSVDLTGNYMVVRKVNLMVHCLAGSMVSRMVVWTVES